MGFELQFTDKEITAWGGMALMKRMLDHMEFEQALNLCALPQPGSNRGYSPNQLIIQFMLSVWCGANRFEHCEVTRHDPVLSRLFGYGRMANFKAMARLFQKFDQATNARVFDSLFQWFYSQLHIDDLTLDLDSTVMTRFGQQQGAARGYNPAKPGRNSHHPLLAFVADTRMVANFWMRPGNTHTANNVSAFLAETRNRLGGKSIRLLRADSGFSDSAFLDEMDESPTHYLIALRLNQPLQRALAASDQWWALEEGIELVRLHYQAPCWNRSRIVVGIRQRVDQRPDAKGKILSLFQDDPAFDNYRYSAIVTDMNLPAEVLWRTYRGRADCENRIKELKYDFGADSFNLNDFWATEAALSVCMIAYNLMSLFRQVILRSGIAGRGKGAIQHTLATLRYKLFAMPGYITSGGRQNILKLAIAMRHRDWITGLWDQAKSFDIPVQFSPILPNDFIIKTG